MKPLSFRFADPRHNEDHHDLAVGCCDFLLKDSEPSCRQTCPEDKFGAMNPGRRTQIQHWWER